SDLDKHLLTPTSPTYLETGWFHEGNSISLPTKVAANSNETFTINYEMDERFHDQQTLLIRTSLQDIRVFVDDVLIYERQFGSEPFDPYASLWHMVDVHNHRSEERRVGKECRSRRWRYDCKRIKIGRMVVTRK